MRSKLGLAALVVVSAIAAAAFMATLILIPGAPRSEGWRDAPTQVQGWPLTDGGTREGYTQAGHKTDTPRRFAPSHACRDVDAVIHIIELSRVSDAAVAEFFNQMAVGGTCKFFPAGLTFWPDVVVVKMDWADGDLMWIVKGHDRTEAFPLYTWMTARRGRMLGVPPPG